MQRNPQPPATLDNDHVHVWQVAADRMDPSMVNTLRGLLSDDEIARAERFHFERDRTTFILARGLLRTLLGNYLNSDPARLEFRYGPHGKPELAPATGGGNLQFNLAHSRGLIVYAFCYERRVGIDVESLQREVDYLRIAREFFSPREIAVLMSLPAAQQRPAFFRGWACKEAYLKARGVGLHYGLNKIDVSLRPDEPAALLDDRNHPEEVPRWRLETLTPAPDYAGALAVEGTDWTLRCWDYV